MSERTGKVYRLEAQIAALESERDDAIKVAWPLYSSVSWIKTGRHPAFGDVVMHGYGGRLKVLNAETLKEVWITPHHIGRASNPTSDAP